MIICVCRNIREQDFETKEDMIQRVMQSDHNCGQCQRYCQQFQDQENVCIK
jgi:bacterioferritin-associated ferredoxin